MPVIKASLAVLASVWLRRSDCTALHCISLHCTALHCTALYSTALHFTVQHCTSLHCTALHCTALHFTALHCTAPLVDDCCFPVCYDSVTIALLTDCGRCSLPPRLTLIVGIGGQQQDEWLRSGEGGHRSPLRPHPTHRRIIRFLGFCFACVLVLGLSVMPVPLALGHPHLRCVQTACLLLSSASSSSSSTSSSSSSSSSSSFLLLFFSASLQLCAFFFVSHRNTLCWGVCCVVVPRRCGVCSCASVSASLPCAPHTRTVWCSPVLLCISASLRCALCTAHTYGVGRW